MAETGMALIVAFDLRRQLRERVAMAGGAS